MLIYNVANCNFLAHDTISFLAGTDKAIYRLEWNGKPKRLWHLERGLSLQARWDVFCSENSIISGRLSGDYLGIIKLKITDNKVSKIEHNCYSSDCEICRPFNHTRIMPRPSYWHDRKEIHFWGNYNDTYLVLFPYFAKMGRILAMPLELFCKIDSNNWSDNSFVLFRRGTNTFQTFALDESPEVATFSPDGMTLAVATKNIFI